MSWVLEDVVAAVAAVGLEERAWPAAPPDPSDWHAFRRQLDANRLVGLAALAVESGRLVLDGAQRAELVADDVMTARHTVQAEAAMLALTAALDEAAIPVRILKGSAAALLDWSIPERRRWVDSDLLVRGADLAAAVSTVEVLGATRRVPELRPGFDRRFGKSVTLDAPTGEVDLHRSLVIGPHCFLVDLDDLWEDGRGFEVCGRRLQGLAAPVAFVHYAMHATIAGAQRLGNLRDVVECARHVDLDAAGRVAQRWKATAIVQAACAHVRDRLGFGADHPLARWGAALRPTDEERRLLAGYEPAAREAPALVRRSLRYVPGALDKARFVYAVTWPSSANRAARQRSAPAQAAQLRRLVRRSRS